MHPDVTPFVESGRISPEIGERLSSIAPGTFCYHKSWGAGKTISWDLSRGKIVIDFERSSLQEMGLQLALQKTEPIKSEDFRAQKIDAIDDIKELANNDPVELVIRTLRSHGGSMKMDAFDKEICGLIIEQPQYKKWWETTKKLLRESRKVVVPTKRADPLVLRDESISPVESILADFQEAFDLKQKARIIDELKGEVHNLSKEVLLTLCESINDFSAKSLKLKLGATLDLLGARDELLEAFDKELIKEQSLPIHSILKETSADLTSEIGALSATRQRRIYQTFPVAFGEDQWTDKILTSFDSNTARGVTEIAKILVEQGKEKDLLSHVQKSLSHHKLGADALAWICRERNKITEPLFDGQVGIAILSLLEQDSMDDGPRRTGRLANLLSSDKTLIGDLVSTMESNEVRLFSRKLLQNPAFPELDRKSLMARVIKSRPEAQKLLSGEAKKADQRPDFIVSWKSLEKRKQDYQHLIETLIPENIKEIAVARSYGDLRENFEYKAAKQTQTVLNRRREDLERDLENAQGTDFKNADTSSINIGTIITLKNPETNDSLSYTILGAWDSQPEQNILPYLSNIGQALLGKKVGESVQIPDMETDQTHTLIIDSIEAYNPA